MSIRFLLISVLWVSGVFSNGFNPEQNAFVDILVGAAPAYRVVCGVGLLGKYAQIPSHVMPRVIQLKDRIDTAAAAFQSAKDASAAFITTPENAVIALLSGVHYRIPVVIEKAIDYLVTLDVCQLQPGSRSAGVLLELDENNDFKTNLACRLYESIAKAADSIAVESPEGILDWMEPSSKTVLPKVFDVLVKMIVQFAVTPVGEKLLGQNFARQILELIAHKDVFKRCPRLIRAANKLCLWSKSVPNKLPPLWYVTRHIPKASLIYSVLDNISSSDWMRIGSKELFVTGITLNGRLSLREQCRLLHVLVDKGCSLNQAKLQSIRQHGSLYHVLCSRVAQPGSNEEQAVADLIAHDAPTALVRGYTDEFGDTLKELALRRGLSLVVAALK